MRILLAVVFEVPDGAVVDESKLRTALVGAPSPALPPIEIFLDWWEARFGRRAVLAAYAASAFDDAALKVLGAAVGREVPLASSRAIGWALTQACADPGASRRLERVRCNEGGGGRRKYQLVDA